jgi:hypothetical protein
MKKFILKTLFIISTLFIIGCNSISDNLNRLTGSGKAINKTIVEIEEPIVEQNFDEMKKQK